MQRNSLRFAAVSLALAAVSACPAWPVAAQTANDRVRIIVGLTA